MTVNRRAFTTALLTATQFRAAWAQPAWPNKPVTVTVGFPPGQATDIFARTVADELSKSLKQAFVIDNKPGAGATIAASISARAKPDGYTVHVGTSGNLAIAPHQLENLTYNPTRDFDYVAVIGKAPLVLVVRPDSKFVNLKQLLDAGTSAANVAVGSGGEVQRLALSLLKTQSNSRFNDVPYKGSSQAMTDLIGGTLDASLDSLTAAAPFIKNGLVRALAVTSSTRVALFPQVPTVAETVPEFEAVGWALFCVPRGTPREIVDTLSRETLSALAKPSVKTRFDELGVVIPKDNSPENTRDWVLAEYKRWGALIQQTKGAGPKQ